MKKEIFPGCVMFKFYSYSKVICFVNSWISVLSYWFMHVNFHNSQLSYETDNLSVSKQKYPFT